MSPSQTSVPGQKHIAPKEGYEKPRVITFGSVAKLTKGSTGSTADMMSALHHHAGKG